MSRADTYPLDAVVRKLRAIDGVIDVWRVPDSERRTILNLEKSANQNAGLVFGVEIVNKAAEYVLKRTYVVCINHSQALRHPPAPILILTAGEDIAGEEVWEKERIDTLHADPDVLFLGKGFVLFKNKVNQTKEKRLRFEYRPQDFPEIETIHGVRDVVSGTISPTADIHIKRMAGWNTSDADRGTVLIGFNSSL
jgi:hypothetical protein